ncbi:hypothetical protein HETIRDRAFT_54721 [Heterobasidion irregulare TC 32-1]|uniref:Uncharacterized protein n=1 Tax=Heterobasidion irregulare (strain TC 32-1) TaxID=747525 RepID=W4KCN5_HETIT|nr:uncharacterized protein HETIRDRAFT_54721 [Heterobasidion irregulare TC 32-1]ETW82811.1 hypothetical protein HETIRDRAFT_54721 [Heterobasidion irregulare TC 32-1]
MIVSNWIHYARAKATIDLACKGIIVNKVWVKKHCFPIYSLNHPICIHNVNDTINQAGLIYSALDVNLKIWDIHR